jgi:hypothetical protein
MKGDAKVIDYLNQALRLELTAINQYWLHSAARQLGLPRAGEKGASRSMSGARRQAGRRIIFLEACPAYGSSIARISQPPRGAGSRSRRQATKRTHYTGARERLPRRRRSWSR